MFNDWGNWKDICKSYLKHDDKVINGFFFDYRWLSNFYKSWATYDGVFYPYSENAYHAAKVKSAERKALTQCTAAESKKLWQLLAKLEETPEQWDARKYGAMVEIIFSKFLLNKGLRQQLIDTGDRHLEETNHWHDKFWGVCVCKKCGGVGQNNLGKILMKTREFWK